MTFAILQSSQLSLEVFKCRILDRYGYSLNIEDNQFGFSRGLLCNDAIYSARAVVKQFTK